MSQKARNDFTLTQKLALAVVGHDGGPAYSHTPKTVPESNGPNITAFRIQSVPFLLKQEEPTASQKASGIKAIVHLKADKNGLFNDDPNQQTDTEPMLAYFNEASFEVRDTERLESVVTEIRTALAQQPILGHR